MAPVATSTTVDPLEDGSKITELHPSLQHIGFTDTLQFYLNGQLKVLRNPNPEGALIDYIRDQPNLTATKMPCGEGGCGACSVVQATYRNGEIKFETVNSCLVPLISIEGSFIITAEGLGTVKNPHPIQERIAKFHGSQCGFCTPGIVMSLYGLLRAKNGHVSKDEITEALDGNLCRCTGYMPILDAAFTFAYDSENFNLTKKLELDSVLKQNSNDSGFKGCAREDCCQKTKKPKPSDSTEVCSKGDACCKLNKDPEATTENPETEIDMNLLFTPNGLPLKPYQPEEEILFPKALTSFERKPVFYGNDYKVWFRPTTKLQLLQILKAYPESKLVSGASEVQIEVRIKASDYKRNIFVNHIDELRTWEYIEGKGLLIGGNLPLTQLEHICESLCETLPAQNAQVFKMIATQLKYFAGRQVRNVATPAGNIVTASPIADLNPILVSSKATIFAAKLDLNDELEEVEVSMDGFFTGYRKHKLPANSIITKVFIPETAENEYIHCYKQSKRKDDDIAIVTSCLRVKLNSEGLVEDSSLIYGGMAPMTVKSPKTEEFLQGKSIFDEKVIESAIDRLDEDFPLKFNVPGGMATYRRTLTFSFFYKFVNYVLSFLEKPVDATILDPITRKHPNGYRELVQPFKENVVGSSVPHVNSLKQATGEAQYVEDIPPYSNEVFGVQVLSIKAHAKVVSVDWTLIYQVDTVIGYCDINDLPSKDINKWGALPFGKEDFFAEEEVHYVGQCIGVVFASDKERAAELARLVKVVYQDLPMIITAQDAVEQNSFFEKATRKIIKGDFETNYENAKYKFENSVKFGAQEHFYFEPQNCIAIPEEDGELKIISSSQNPKETQEYAAQVTGVPMHKVVAKVKRLGGGFGGKETRAVQLSSLAAVGANKFNRPVRMILSRYDDMLVSGQRHPFYMKWKCGMDENYKIVAYKLELYANGGWSMDLSQGVLDRAVLHLQNCYNIENCYILGKVCKTNIASNTAFRGFGGPQGMYLAESMMVDISERLDVDVELLRERNYHDKTKLDQTTPYKQKVFPDYTVVDLVEQNKETSKYEEIKKEVTEFNKKSKWIKRGLAHVPTMFGVSFGATFLNQAGALIHIYHDGSVLVSHGGVEIGQGLNTKMIMIVAEELNVPMEKVFISETSTQLVPNTSATAASAASDLNGMACKLACDKLNERMAPIRAKHPDATFDQIVHHCYFERISLSATGFYKTPDIGYEFGVENPKPPFFYYTQGSAVAEVEVDTLTGDWSALKTYIKMDIGRPINQAIDYGQIEGAFVQGMGLFTIEQSLWFNHNGALATRGPGNYKIPGFKDIPQVFHISMLNDRKFDHLKTIKKSKGIGEPPLFLGCAVHFAIRDAIKSARKEHVLSADDSEEMPFISPLTTDRIRNNIGDFLYEKGKVVVEGNEFFIEL